MNADTASPERRAAVLTASDRVAAGERDDTSGSILAERLEEAGWTVVERAVVPDEVERIAERLRAWSDARIPLVVTTGGTGIAPRDVTPDATRLIADREVPGIAEALRADSLTKTPHAMLSRATAAVAERTLIVNLPGSPKAIRETFDVLAPVLDHATRLIGPVRVADDEHRPDSS